MLVKDYVNSKNDLKMFTFLKKEAVKHFMVHYHLKLEVEPRYYRAVAARVSKAKGIICRPHFYLQPPSLISLTILKIQSSLSSN